MERRKLIEAVESEIKRLEEVRRLLAGPQKTEKPKIAKGRVRTAEKRSSDGGTIQQSNKKAWKKSSKKIVNAGRIIGRFGGGPESGGSGGTDDGGYGFTGD